MNRPTRLDLFCGCGGFTLGMAKQSRDAHPDAEGSIRDAVEKCIQADTPLFSVKEPR